MDTASHSKPRYGHAEGTFEGTREGLDAAYAFVRTAVGDAIGAAAVGDVLLILAGNAIAHSDTGAGGRFRVQIATMAGYWQLRIDDDGTAGGQGPRLLGGDRGEPLHGLAALNDAGIMWTLRGAGAILAEIGCPLREDDAPDLSEPAKRAAESVR